MTGTRPSLWGERRRSLRQSAQTRKVTGTAVVDRIPYLGAVGVEHELGTVREHPLGSDREVRHHELGQVGSLRSHRPVDRRIGGSGTAGRSFETDFIIKINPAPRPTVSDHQDNTRFTPCTSPHLVDREFQVAGLGRQHPRAMPVAFSHPPLDTLIGAGADLSGGLGLTQRLGAPTGPSRR